MFLASFLAFFMFLNSPFILLRRCHISFSLILFSSLSFFFFKSLLFSAISRGFIFRLFLLFHFCFLEIIKIVNVYWFLLVCICFFSSTFIIVWIFSQRVNLHFVFLGLEYYMKIAFQVKTSLFGSSINFWINVRINILENVLVPTKIVLK